MNKTFEEVAKKKIKACGILANTYTSYDSIPERTLDKGLVLEGGGLVYHLPWLEFAKNWHSDEEYQELLSKYSGLNDNYEKEVIKSSKFETSNSKLIAEGTGLLSDNAMLTKKIASLNSQLEHQSLTVVPEFVAEAIEKDKQANVSISDVFEATFSYENHHLTEAGLWTKNNPEQYIVARNIGYTVQKPKRFYLKHIDASKRDPDYDYYLLKSNEELDHEWVGYEETPEAECFKFTQEEIDSMQTGSYEKIEVSQDVI